MLLWWWLLHVLQLLLLCLLVLLLLLLVLLLGCGSGRRTLCLLQQRCLCLAHAGLKVLQVPCPVGGLVIGCILNLGCHGDSLLRRLAQALQRALPAGSEQAGGTGACVLRGLAGVGGIRAAWNKSEVSNSHTCR